MKIVAICGSLKFKDDIIYWSEKLELEGNCVLGIIYPTKADKDAYMPAERAMLDAAHKKKIDLSDAIFVVNKGGYIGGGTKGEIEYARARGKEIMFMEN